MSLMVFYLCRATLTPYTMQERAWGVERAACDYTESGQMERGFLIPLHPHVMAELGCNLLFHDSRAQFLPSRAGTLVAVSWAG